MYNYNKNNKVKCDKCSNKTNKNKVKLFICYSSKLTRFLKRHGVKYSAVGLNPNNYKKFYVFIGCDKLNALLNVWSKIKLKNNK